MLGDRVFLPVRDGLRTLEAEGLIGFPNRGAVVSEVSVDELEEIYSISAILECMAARIAVTKLTPEQLEKVGEIKQDIKRCTDGLDRWLKLNNFFHLQI